MKNSQTFGVVLVVFFLISGIAASAQTEKSVIIVVNSAGSSWPDGTFANRLNDLIAETSGVAVADAEDARWLLDRSKGHFDKQEAIDQGTESEHRFVLWCDIKREEMKIEKGFAFPFLASQRRVIAMMEIEYRIVDCVRGRLISSEKFKVKEHGPSTMQYLDASDADPNLYVSYFDRKEMFDKLEEAAADKLSDAFSELARQR